MRSLLLGTLICLVACTPSESRAGDSPSDTVGSLAVAAVNYPLAFFAEWIGDDAVRVVFPVPAGVDPAAWVPDRKALRAYREADVIFLNGGGYARWVGEASLPPSQTVNTGATSSGRLIAVEGAAAWLDLSVAREQARTICFVLSGARPQYRENFELDLEALEAELREIDERWQACVARDPDRPLLAAGPAYACLAAHLGLNLESVSWRADALPGEESWRQLELLLETHPACWMLWEAPPLPEVALRLESLGIGCVVFDPCASTPDDASDFLDVMQLNTRALEQSFQ